MNPGLVVKLRPSGPWRIGPDSGARNRVDVIYHSDSLYSAVTSAMSRLGWLEDWLDSTARTASPEVSFSSCFPYLDDLVFVIPPRTLWPPPTPSTKAARIRWKSARFIPLAVVRTILAGLRLDENQWSIDGPSDCLVPAGKPGPFRTAVRSNAGVDRLTGVSERHSTACIEFRSGSGLWTVVSFADEAARERWSGKVKAAFRLLADTGFGGERSRGWGRSDAPEFTEGVLPDLILPFPNESPEGAEAAVKATAPIAPLATLPRRDREGAVSSSAEAGPASVETALPEAPAVPTPAAEPDTAGLAAAETTRSPEASVVEAAPTTESAPAVETAPPVAEAAEAASPEAPAVEAAQTTEAAPPVTEAAEAASPEAPAVEAAPTTEAAPPVAEAAEAASPEAPAVEAAPTTEAAPPVAEAAEAASEAPPTDPEPSAADAMSPSPDAPATEPGPPVAEAAEAVSPEAPAVEAAPTTEAAPPVTEAAEAASEAHPTEPVPAVADATPASPGAPAVETAPTTEPGPPVAEAAFKPAFPEATAGEPASAPTHPHWLLSLFTPAPADSVDWRRGNYTVLPRGGRVDSPAGSGELKKQIQMVAEGSVLYAETVPRGSAADVAPDGFAHPVFRAGFAVAIPLPEVR